MVQEEVKPSFSLKYLMLTLLTTVLVSGASVIISKAYESRPVKELEVIQDNQIDVLNDDAFPKDQIEANYHLKSDPKKKVATLIRKVVVIKNSGNEGAENILVSATLEEKNANLVSMPIIRTEPKQIVDALSVKKIEGGTNNKHTWNISLLNPGESLIFEYYVYSEEKLGTIKLNILPRKKDWNVVIKPFLSNRDDKDSFIRTIFIAASAPVLLMLVILIGAIPFYRYQWNRRPDYRKEYGSFLDFYNRHRPWNLFKPSSKLTG